MTVHITMQSVITAAACAAALLALVGYILRAHNWFSKQNKQEGQIKAIKEEQQLLT